MSARQFVATQARRARVPLFIGLAGPSGSGKTYSAQRLARGIVRASGGDVYGVDTEAGRMLHYAHDDKCGFFNGGKCSVVGHFEFKHVPFAAPFGAFDYLDAIRFCTGAGAGCVIIDSASHMHEGQGGMLDQQVRLLDGWCGDSPKQGEQDWEWQKRRDKNAMRAWIEPKRELGRFVQALLQLQTNVIFCFRAKEKIKPGGDKPINLGMSAIADDSLIFEMTVQALLSAGCGGVPSWRSDLPNERLQTKLPRQFESMLTSKGQPLDETMGEMMGRWAMGEAAPDLRERKTASGDTAAPAPRVAQSEERAAPAQPSGTFQDFVKRIKSATDAELKAIGAEIASVAQQWTDEQRKQARDEIRARRAELH